MQYIFAATILFDVVVIIWFSFLSKNKRENRTLTRLYQLLFSSIVLWEIGLWLSFFIDVPPNLILFDQMSFAFGAIAVSLSAYFMWEVVGRLFFPSWLIHLIVAAGVFLFIVTCIPGVLIESREYVGEFSYNYVLHFGPMMFWYYALLSPIIFLEIYLFIRGMYSVSGVYKSRLQFVGIGLIVTVLLGTSTSIWWPFIHYLVFRDTIILGDLVTNFAQIAAGIGASAFSVFSAYAISRYRFLNVRVFLKKSFVYSFFLVLGLILYFGVFYGLYTLFGSMSIWFVAIGCILFVGPYIRSRLLIFLDGIFFRDQLLLSDTVDERVRRIHSSKEIQVFIDEFRDTVSLITTATVQSFYILEKEHLRLKQYYPVKNKGYISFKDRLYMDFQHCSHIVYPTALDNNTRMQKFVDSHDGVLCVIFYVQQRIGAIAVLSAKDDAQPYYADEIERLQKVVDSITSHLETVLYFHDTIVALKQRL